MRQVVRSWASLWRCATAFFCLFVLPGGAALAAEPRVSVAVGQSGMVFSIDAVVDVQVPLATAWEVMTDYDHMTTLLGNLTASKVSSRNGNTLVVRQEGVARYGLFSFAFESEREIRLEPMKRILSRNLSGSLKRMDSESDFLPLGQGLQIKYHAEFVADSMLVRLFGASFVRHEVEEQFQLLAREMARRHAPSPAGFSPPSE
ncbi:MAG: SRPBCC family protein [Rhodocyclaceae bacterium]|nr:SRPBCC family protein [Rhodocyclaceae bacterium]